MKKQYQKPIIYHESFDLCEHIASGCMVDKSKGVYAGYINSESCAFVDGNVTIYMDPLSGVCAGMDMGLADSLEEFVASLECYNSFSGYVAPFVS